MPAMPMNEAAERYSPEIAEAFQPTDTERPATKKSLAVFECCADQKPMPDGHDHGDEREGEDPRIDAVEKGEGEQRGHGSAFDRFHRLTSSSSSAIERRMKLHEMIQTNGKNSTPEDQPASA